VLALIVSENTNKKKNIKMEFQNVSKIFNLLNIYLINLNFYFKFNFFIVKNIKNKNVEMYISIDLRKL